MSGSSAKWTTSADWPASTARDWSPEAPNEFENSTPSPSGVALNPGSRSPVYASSGVEYATRSREPPELGGRVVGSATRRDSERERAGEGGDGEQPGTAAGPRVRHTVFRGVRGPAAMKLLKEASHI